MVRGMTALPLAAAALTGAFDRLERASYGVREAAIGASDPAKPLTDLATAKRELQAAVAVTRIADDMLGELLKLQAR